MALVISRFDITAFDGFKFDDASTGGGGGGTPDAILFNSYGLQNANIITSEVIYSAASRQLQEAAYARADGEYMETAYWRKTIITLNGFVKSTTQTGLEQLMDLMRQNLATAAGTLSLTVAGQTRVWTAYADISKLFDGRKQYHKTFCPFSVSFICITPFGQSSSRVNSTGSATTSPTVFTVSPSGTAPTKQIITLNFNTAGTASAVTLTNSTTGEAITITASFNNGDTLVIDGEGKTVKLNGTAVDYTGIFPTLAAGTNSVQLTVTGSGFTIAFTSTYLNQYY